MSGTITPPLLELNEATVLRRSTPVLERISLRIGRGEHTAIIGPNGSGKSTLLHLLTRRLYPLARPAGPAPIRIFGRERWHIEELRSRMGIISSDLHQRFVVGMGMEGITARDAVVASFFSSEVLFLHHQVEPEMIRKAERSLERMGALALADRRLSELSTGEARRILIARALVHEPELLVLDEPTTGLDLVARHDFLEQIRRLAHEGTTLILITHHVEEIVPEIERVVLLERGRVAADGSPAHVLTPDRLGHVYGSEVQIRRVGRRYEMTLPA